MTDFSKEILHYSKLGHGPKILLAFHGIGQDGASCFKPFKENLGESYTIYAFDIFFHGKSDSSQNYSFSDKQPLIKPVWAALINDFLTKENISHFDIAGFSMGGRFALATLELFSARIDKAFLIAPDGVSEHPLYTLASRFSPTRNLFRWSMKNPKLFLKTADILQKVGLIHGSLYRFTKNILDTPDKRKVIYYSWLTFRKLRFNISSLYQKIVSDHIDLYLFIGKYDRLLNENAVKKLTLLLPSDRYIILQSGHSQLVEKVAIYLKLSS